MWTEILSLSCWNSANYLAMRFPRCGRSARDGVYHFENSKSFPDLELQTQPKEKDHNPCPRQPSLNLCPFTFHALARMKSAPLWKRWRVAGSHPGPKPSVSKMHLPAISAFATRSR